jgi:hypothetical protein
MLKPAFCFQTELNLEYRKHLYSENFKFLIEDVWEFEITVDANDSERLQFVSVNPANEVLAYFSASINRRLYKVDSVEVIIFHNNSIASRDLMTFVKNLTGKFGFKKINFEGFVGSPGEKVYDKHLKILKARIVGIKKNEVRLSDGKLYDVKLYEILPE